MSNMLRRLKLRVKSVPILGTAVVATYRHFHRPVDFTNSPDYWEQRYKAKWDSGDGSYGRLSEFKAEVLNKFVADNSINTIVELGCGDGSQLSLAKYPAYLGLDIAPSALDICRKRFRGDPNKSFEAYPLKDGRTFDLAMSLDVIYHLVEDEIFDKYMRQLFDASHRWVAIYSSNDPTTESPTAHVRHRRFADWIEINAQEWSLDRKIDQRYPISLSDNDLKSFADFYFYLKKV